MLLSEYLPHETIFQDWLVLFFPPFLKIPFGGFVATDGDGRDELNVTGIMLRTKGSEVGINCLTS